MRPENARLLIEQCGEGLYRLLGELDKLCAIALEWEGKANEITRDMIEAAATKNLEASVFDLSKALLQGRYDGAYRILDRLFFQREEPVAILGVLISAYADLYRVKVADAAGEPAESLAADSHIKAKNSACVMQPDMRPNSPFPRCGSAWKCWRRRIHGSNPPGWINERSWNRPVASLILTGKRDRQGERHA